MVQTARARVGVRLLKMEPLLARVPRAVDKAQVSQFGRARPCPAPKDDERVEGASLRSPIG
jgi:hypothetical protein